MHDVVVQSAERRALARWDNEGGALADGELVNTLPKPVVDLANRLGADASSRAKIVTLTQSGDMRLGEGAYRTRFRAKQTINLRETGFAWRASMAFGAISVSDAYRDGVGALDVRLFGRIRLAQMSGPAVAKGEIMRYLAELPLAPDAILFNRALAWSVVDERTLWVAAGSGAGRGRVRLDLDEDGRVGSIFAPDRPYADGKNTNERPWSGRFLNYRLHAGRCLPFAAEVGWTIDGQVSNYWRGTLSSWAVA